ncbi:hypothetical protein BD770DRAFT_297381, partial [Pilaira anomala]
LCLQETHANSQTKIDTLNVQFQPSREAFWTEHLGIMSFSLDYQITLIDTQHLYASTRYQICKVQHPHNFYAPFFILNLYAPVSPAPARREFFQQLTHIIDQLQQQSAINMEKLIICGDFNYSHLRTSTIASSSAEDWRLLLSHHFYNSMQI